MVEANTKTARTFTICVEEREREFTLVIRDLVVWLAGSSLVNVLYVPVVPSTMYRAAMKFLSAH